MSIFAPDRLVHNALATGLVTIKSDMNTYLRDICDTNLFGTDYIAMVKTYLTNNKVSIVTGYPLSDERLPGWFVIQPSVQPDTHFIGDYMGDNPTDVYVENENGDLIPLEDKTGYVIAEGQTGDHLTIDESQGEMKRYSLKIITASSNTEITLFLELIARYILYTMRSSFSDYNFHEVEISTTDLDPLYQFLPQHHMKRTTLITGKGIDYWTQAMPAISSIRIFGKFNPMEDYIEI